MQTHVFLNAAEASPAASAPGSIPTKVSPVERAWRRRPAPVADTGGAADALRSHLVEALDQAVVAVGEDGAIAFMNRAAEELYGCTAAWAEGRPATDVLAWDLGDEITADLLRCAPDAAPWLGDLVVRGDQPRPVSATISPVRVDGDVVAMAVTARDTVERDRARAALHHRMTHDEVTGLSNRQGAVARIDQLIEEHRGSPTPLVVIRVDVDGLRSVSDAFGEDTACEVTRAVARSVAQAAHTGDVVARTSDASLVICCPHVSGVGQARDLADRLCAVAANPTAVGSRPVALRAAAGIAIDDGETRAEELLHRADIAVAHERELSRYQTSVYDHALRGEILRQIDVEALIRRAIATDEVSLAYQPVVRVTDQTIVGAEALLRMTDERGDPVPAPEAISVAERTGLISELGLVILRTACKEAARWQHDHPERPLGVAVNVSASQLGDAAFPDHVDAALRMSGLDPARLTLEMTETVLMADSTRSTRQLARLKMSGVHLSADDFGTGYSSLAYLKRFPLDVIKADLSFIAGLPDSPEDVAVVAAIIAMAEAVGLDVVAEGVENLRQLGELERLGCRYAQGFLWSRAVPGDEFLEMAQREAGGGSPDQLRFPEGDLGTTAGDDGLEVAFRFFAHEVRSPLTIVNGWASMLETEDLASMDPAEVGVHIRRAGERIERLLVNLDDVVALEEGRLRLDAKPIDLRALVADVLESMALRLSAPVVFDRADRRPAAVHADGGRIEQVIINLVANAAKFSPAGSPVEVVIGHHGSWVDVSILDQGPGIPEADVALAFRKFGRLDRAVAGTGMGLYLARGIARAHGGEVCYRRRAPAGGAIFNLRLPITGPGSEVALAPGALTCD